MRYLVCLLVAFLVLAPLAFGEVGNAEGSGDPTSGFPAPPNPRSEGMLPFDLDLTAPGYTYSGWNSGSSGYEAYPGGSSEPSGYGGHPQGFAEPASYSGYPGEPGAPPGYGSYPEAPSGPSCWSGYPEESGAPPGYGGYPEALSGSGPSCWSGYPEGPGAPPGYGGYPVGPSGPSCGYGHSPGPSTGCCGFWYTDLAVSQSNTYYVQTWPHGLSTVTSVRCGDWIPLWSMIGTPGTYWSFEWTLGDPYHGWTPDIKNFGYKNFGWYPSWFRSSTPGWHLLCYYCNDWSNYVYIYVKPFH